MNNLIILLVFSVFSNVLTLSVEKLKKGLLPSELSRIKLRSRLAECLIEEEKIAHEIENLDSLKGTVEWFNKFDELKGLVTPTSEAIEAEKKELEVFKELLEEVKKKNLEDYIKSLKKQIESSILLSDDKQIKLDEHQVAEIKKWLLACKYVKDNGVCSAEDVKELADDRPTAIKILQKDHSNGLLKELSEKVKVQVWPLDLNISRLITKYRNRSFFENLSRIMKMTGIYHFLRIKAEESILLKKAGKELLGICENILKNVSDAGLKAEIKAREEFVEGFIEPDNGLTTIDLYSARMIAFPKLIDTLIERLEHTSEHKEHTSEQKSHESISLTAIDVSIIKDWLFFNQMILAEDPVTRSGRFVKEWAKDMEIRGYQIPELVDEGGFFGHLNKKVEEVEEKEEKKKEEKKTIRSRISSAYKSVKNSVKSFFGFGKKSDDSGATGATESKGVISSIMEKGKKSAEKLYNVFARKDVRKPDPELKDEKSNAVQVKQPEKPEEKQSSGWLSSLFSSKTKKPEETIVKPQETTTTSSSANQANQVPSENDEKSKDNQTVTPVDNNSTATKSDTTDEPKKTEQKGLFSSWFSSEPKTKTVASPTPTQKKNGLFSFW